MYDYTVRILDFDKGSIRVEDRYYLRENCELIIFENYLRII